MTTRPGTAGATTMTPTQSDRLPDKASAAAVGCSGSAGTGAAFSVPGWISGLAADT